MRADPAQVVSGFIDATVLLARTGSERIGTPADELVRVFFAGAGGSLTSHAAVNLRPMSSAG